MLNLENVLIEACEDNWKDWFIADEAKEKIQVLIYLNSGKQFNVDSRFQRFKITGISNYIIEPCFLIWYIFYEGNNKCKIQRVHGHSRIIDSNSKLIQFFIKR